MTDLNQAVRAAMQQQARVVSQFAAHWRAATAWQHKQKGAPTHG
jgi:hypothetical protein